MTDSNLGIAIASLVICVVRGVTGRLHYSPRFVEVLYDIMLGVLWTTCTIQQLSGDFTDLDHPSQHPWYLTKSCRVSWKRNRSFCRVSQASFVTSVLAILFSTGHLILYVVRGFRRAGNNTQEMWEEEVEMKLDTIGLRRATEIYSCHSQALSPILAFFPEEIGRVSRPA